MMTAAIQITTTTESREVADRLAALLVERRLAACVQISGPIASTYRWQGKIESSTEWLCVAKTKAELFAAAEAAIRAAHIYETPEIIATPIVAASAAYLAWLTEQVSNSGPQTERAQSDPPHTDPSESEQP